MGSVIYTGVVQSVQWGRKSDQAKINGAGWRQRIGSRFPRLPKGHWLYTAEYRVTIRVPASRGSIQRTSSAVKIEIPATATARLRLMVLRLYEDTNPDSFLVLVLVLVLILATHARSTITAPSLAWYSVAKTKPP